MRPRVAVVLFNLGGPDRPESIRPFLRNLFDDPVILRVPFFVRPWLARRIVSARLGPARASYALLGGRSPLLDLTRRQAAALETELAEVEAKCFIAMRYWHPFSDETARAVRDWGPDEVVLLPLYPQYSSTTTGSSLTAWREAAARVGLAAATSVVCCYPTDENYVAATAGLLREAWRGACAELGPGVGLRVLFSAHGLPEAIVQAGDPYQWQIEQTVACVLAAFGQQCDWTICYQSRATPQRWIEPSTEHEIARAARDKVAVLVVPIAFVSDHSETLVELDVDYRALADR
ncbi:MAG TPA: ferrochelatase, partial [Acetobacteraceae bacterium]